MASPPVAAPPRRRSFFRRWFPCIVLALAALGVAAAWVWPSEELDRGTRVVSTGAAITLAALLLAVWLVFFSGLRWLVSLGCLLAAALAVLVGVRDVTFTGDMVPVVAFRWSPTQDDVLEAYRQQQRAALLGPVEFSGRDAAAFPEYRGRARDGVVTGPP